MIAFPFLPFDASPSEEGLGRLARLQSSPSTSAELLGTEWSKMAPAKLQEWS